MGKTNGFLDFQRTEIKYREVDKRLADYNEVTIDKSVEELGIGVHDMDLKHALAIVLLQRLVLGLRIPLALRIR